MKPATSNTGLSRQDLSDLHALLWRMCADSDDEHGVNVNLDPLLDNLAILDLSQVDQRGWTPLHRTAKSGNHHACKLLLKHGADPNAVNQLSTPMHLAAQRGHALVCELLAIHGAKLEMKDAEQLTPLELAIRMNEYSTCLLLKAMGAEHSPSPAWTRGLAMGKALLMNRLQASVQLGRPDFVIMALNSGEAPDDGHLLDESPLQMTEALVNENRSLHSRLAILNLLRSHQARKFASQVITEIRPPEH